MAIVQNPLIGRAKGSFANTIFCTSRKQNIIRSKPISVNNPKTESQEANRSKMKAVTRYAQQLNSVSKLLHPVLRDGLSAYNEVASLLSKNVVGGVGANGLQWKLFVGESTLFSKGSLCVPNGKMLISAAEVTGDDNNVKITFEHTNQINQGNFKLSDKYLFVFYETLKDKLTVATPDFTRVSGLLTKEFNVMLETTTNVFVWACFYNDQSRTVSETVYLDELM